MTTSKFLPFRCLLLGCAIAGSTMFAPAAVVDAGSLHFSYTNRGIFGLASKDDPYAANVTSPQQPLSLTVRFQPAGGNWMTYNNAFKLTVSERTNAFYYSDADTNSPLQIDQSFTTDGTVLDWNIDIANRTNVPVTIGDLGIDIPAVAPGSSEDPKQIFERGFMKHQFISGNGSFMYYVRASGAGPFLIVTVQPGTSLEYFGGGGGGRGGGGLVYVHSALTAGNEKRGTWRQPNTSRTLSGAGSEGSKAHYGFRFQFAKTYDDMRDILVKEGLFDIRAVPGMTVPTDLPARFSLRTKASIESVVAEFPADTTIKRLPDPQYLTCVFEVSFKKLGENRLTITHDGGRKTYLEYFVTEPMETLIKKRSAFLVNRQQIHDTNKWWDGVFGPYDMENKVVRTIDDPDIFVKRMVYNLTCDDPGLCKAPYIAEKNVTFPDTNEIAGLEYYLQHFVWGKLQRTDQETPYPYGVYGTPNWYTDRDPERRRAWVQGDAKGTSDLAREHVWRSYDYPHIVMLYYHMYEIAKKYPEMSHYLDASGYLERAWGTAQAFYKYPMQIYGDYYETYKWGLYNELVVLKLADALDREGHSDRASWLRSEWEKKVKYFVYDDPYPFRSEYAFDRTAFESTYALAKYGATHDMQSDTNLWYDTNHKKWYSHPSVKEADSRAFMDRQLAAGLCVRGWLEASYYQLGADPGVSYMAAMGGWGVLDYAIDFADRPFDWLQLGYASYLSSWCLMNSGTPEDNYGYWFPGKENDGASGWQFISSKVGSAWMYSSYNQGRTNRLEPRGPWHYDGEIDLGYGGALRSAATVVTRDPVFGWFAYGGVLSGNGKSLAVIPRDGLRQRFDALVPQSSDPKAGLSRFKMALDQDGFARENPITLDPALSEIAFTMENRTGDKHTTHLLLSFPEGTDYEVTQDGKRVELAKWNDWDYPTCAEIKSTTTGPTKIRIIRSAAQK